MKVFGLLAALLILLVGPVYQVSAQETKTK